MTDTSNPTPSSNTEPDADKPVRRCGPRGRRRRWVGLGAVFLIGLAGFGIGRATSHPWHGFGRHAHRSVDAVTASQFAVRGIDRMLGKVDATADQKTKITAIAKAAIADMAPAQQAHAAARTRLGELLKADKVDHASIEQLRNEQFAFGDTLTKKVATALVDAADALTSAQRAKLVDLWQSNRR
jgi:periplasmic protein CpxP/Spy